MHVLIYQIFYIQSNTSTNNVESANVRDICMISKIPLTINHAIMIHQNCSTFQPITPCHVFALNFELWFKFRVLFDTFDICTK